MVSSMVSYQEYLKQRYKADREPTLPTRAKDAFNYAKYLQRNSGKVDWDTTSQPTQGRRHYATAKWKTGVFDVRAALYCSDAFYDDASDDGEIIDHPDRDALPFANWRLERPTQWYLPPKDCGISARVEYFRGKGASRGPARDMAIASAKNQRDYYQRKHHTDWGIPTFDVEVKVFLRGREMGGSAIGCVEVGDLVENDPYITECVEDMLHEALRMAEEEAKSLHRALENVVKNGTGVEYVDRVAQHVIPAHTYRSPLMPWERLEDLHRTWRAFLSGWATMQKNPIGEGRCSLGRGTLVWDEPDKKFRKELTGQLILDTSRDCAELYFEADDLGIGEVSIFVTGGKSRDDVQGKYRRLQSVLDTHRVETFVPVRAGGEERECQWIPKKTQGIGA